MVMTCNFIRGKFVDTLYQCGLAGSTGSVTTGRRVKRGHLNLNTHSSTSSGLEASLKAQMAPLAKTPLVIKMAEAELSIQYLKERIASTKDLA